MSECQGPAAADSLPRKGPDALARVLRGTLSTHVQTAKYFRGATSQRR
jgi:hypothetical protein